KELFSERWIQMARTPGTANLEYGFMNWFLNTGRHSLPSAPESSVTFRGNGQNIVYVDWQNDLVVVVRWIDNGPALNEFIGKVLASIRPSVSSAGNSARAERGGAGGATRHTIGL